MPRSVYSTRIGRSQGTNFFWGLVSVFFTAAACYYYWQNHENEQKARVWRDQVMALQEQRQNLISQRGTLQDGLTDQQRDMNARDAMLKDKEAKLNEEQQKLEAVIQQQIQNQQAEQAQLMVLKKFDDLIHHLAKNPTNDIVQHDGFPVLRISNSVLFPPGDSQIKPEGQTLLNEIAQSVGDNLDQFELRVETFSDGELAAPKTSANPPQPHDEAKWVLSEERSASLARFLYDMAKLPAERVLVFNGADSEPVVPTNSKDTSPNRRTEISLVARPKPSSYGASLTVSATNTLLPPPDSTATHPAP